MNTDLAICTAFLVTALLFLYSLLDPSLRAHNRLLEDLAREVAELKTEQDSTRKLGHEVLREVRGLRMEVEKVRDGRQ
ncbi:hypothetical protein JCM8097_002251 [Rhodosporidiobolus ruineniae]